MTLLKFTSWLDNFDQAKEKIVRKCILDLFSRVANITNSSNEQVLQGIDFDPTDTTQEKLESLLSELRAVAFLQNEGFNNIKLQPKHDKRQNFDISAVFNDKIFVIEVACLTQKHSREKEREVDVYKINDNKFINTLHEIAKRKKPQLDVANFDHLKMLIFVINRAPEMQLYGCDDYKKILHELNTKLDWGNGYYLGLVTGSEDMICPKVPPIVLD